MTKKNDEENEYRSTEEAEDSVHIFKTRKQNKYTSTVISSNFAKLKMNPKISY